MVVEPQSGRSRTPGSPQPPQPRRVTGRLPDDGPLSARELAAALDAGRVEVHYQPVVALPSRHVVGFEALARLRFPDGRLVPPGRFVPVAEHSGLVVPLGLEVLRTAVAEAARWRAGGTSIATATVSVNVAPAQLERPDLVDVVRGVLAEHDLPGTALVLEITEHAATSASVRPVLERLAALGVRVALDDFGVGFATLDTLRRVPVQILKLDRSFVAGVTRPGADRAIVRVVVDLADSLGLSVIAEGVETTEQAEVLLRLGCGHVQGFLFARPGPSPDAAAAFVAGAGGRPRSDDTWDADTGWDPALDAAVLAATRLLAEGDDLPRAAVHAVATAAARQAGLGEGAVRAVGRLALVHDVHRLGLDAALPPALSASPRLTRLAALLAPPCAGGSRGVRRPARGRWAPPDALRTGRHEAVREDVELHLLLHAVEAVAVATKDPPLRPDTLAAGLRAVAAHYAQDCPATAALLLRLAAEPPDLVPLADLVEDLDRRRLGRRGMEERLRSLVGITRVLSSSRDTRELLRVALEEVRRIVGSASASLERWERDRGRLRTLVNVGVLGPGERTFPDDESYPIADYPLSGRALHGGLPSIADLDDPDLGDEERALLTRHHKHSSAEVPVYLEGRVWGMIWLATETGDPSFSSMDIELLTAVATLMASVILQAEHLDRSARLAFEDPLTRVGNRRALDDALDDLARASRPVAVALLDVDRLKQINDSEGHARGDAALLRIADALATGVGALPGAVVGRLGGDEFCVVAPMQTRDGLTRLVVDALAAAAADGGPTASVGVVDACGGWQPRQLLASADEALYAAKHRRDRRPGGP